ncbi:hypothetical protein AWB80_06551 [Caballeronia pedi]|uniref:Uncharacterized protein n=1 Tax=Caballeronia pedi TaxID=1777141 RepID=A0A158D9I3_9BURK|nr:hypothetical protein [Caballeronia pedi]SAK91334.1 hypothetical protein AWB80_06551 [Caballeronia pedi]
MNTQNDRAILCATLSVHECDKENFVAWHTHEHLPERMAIPGFVRGRRFVRTDADCHFLILYDVDSLSVLSHPCYLARLNHPTDWTRATLPTFRDGRRSAYRVLAKAGGTRGSYVMSISARPDSLQEINVGLLDDWCGHPGIANIAFAEPDRAASSHVTEESRRSGNRYAEESILLVEGMSERSLREFASTECSRFGFDAKETERLYRLQASVGRD